MYRYSRIAVLAFFITAPYLLWGRLRVSPGSEDVRNLAEQAPLVFRGQIVELNLSTDGSDNKKGIAVVAVDRWYRGAGLQNYSQVPVYFAFDPGTFFQGHNCVDLVLDSRWIFFAKTNGNGPIELFHDCEGALAVSSLLAPHLSGDFLSQIEADFRAGLDDSDPAARLASIQRLAGLGLASSRAALREMIAHGTEDESKWALFATLKTGDVSVLRLAVPLLINLRHDDRRPYPQPDGGIALAIEKLRDPGAVPDLIKILDQAPDELARSCASQALMEIKDRRALDTFVDHLSDPSPYVRYNSLVGIGYITHAPMCTIAKPEDAEKAEPRCKTWRESMHH